MSLISSRPSWLTAAATMLVGACGTTTTSAAPTTGPETTAPGTSGPSGAPISARCSTNSLHIALGSGNGGAGHYFVPIIFTNAGGTCAISGFPGVSYVGGTDERQIGDAAAREPVDTPTLVLRNGESVSAWVDQLTVRAVQAGTAPN